MPFIQTLYMPVSKDVNICGYLSKPKGIRKQKGLGITGINDRKHRDITPLE
jgi:hypothetical protein